MKNGFPSLPASKLGRADANSSKRCSRRLSICSSHSFCCSVSWNQEISMKKTVTLNKKRTRTRRLTAAAATVTTNDERTSYSILILLDVDSDAAALQQRQEAILRHAAKSLHNTCR